MVTLCVRVCAVLLGAGLLKQEACGWCLHARAVSWCVQGTAPEYPPTAAQRLSVLTHPSPASLLMHLLWVRPSSSFSRSTVGSLFSSSESQIMNDTNNK